MAGTFEIVFSGLCLLQLTGTGTDQELIVHLLRTEATETECKEPSGQTVKLHPHQPYLVIPEDSAPDCSATINGVCTPEHMGCKKETISGKDVYVCYIDNRELCVQAVQTQNPIEKTRVLLPSDEKPANSAEAKSTYWFANLDDISNGNIGSLKPGVNAPLVSSSGLNRLIVSRVRSEKGTLASYSVGQACSGSGCAYHVWNIAPPPTNNYSKALTEQVSLSVAVEPRDSIALVDCQQPATYWWRFTPDSGKISVGVENLSVESCEGPPNECIVGPGAHPNRLRHFLWYYQLVDWKEQTCPDYLPAPVCKEAKCKKKATYFPRRGDANHFCPPTTYP